jgi:hypothetical protein
MQAPDAVHAAEDLGYQVERCLTMPERTKNSIPPLEIRVDAAGAVLDIGTVGEPPVAPSRRFAIQVAASAIKLCSPFTVTAAGIYPVTLGDRAGGQTRGGNSFDPLKPIPQQNP